MNLSEVITKLLFQLCLIRNEAAFSKSEQSGLHWLPSLSAFFGTRSFKANPAVTKFGESLAKWTVVLQEESATGGINRRHWAGH